eukprot:TRINITY_DN4053_c2_g2_i6.p1 TRINITY_DN4053_c2_g2~~TRINITY_DN4053_c2_g2_i6.p1  ORF type:complete len:955 (-),score=202.93 TRINITY_DN4053_c2_g2_i6:514-3378(-)
MVDQKITEKSEKSRREFFKKVHALLKERSGDKNISRFFRELSERAALEYNKVFGRVGVQPLLQIKGGKGRPRYLLDRDETWVLYKPPLWQMGGNALSWPKKVEQTATSCNSLPEAQQKYMDSGKVECLQEWHGLCQGFSWLDPKKEVDDWGFIQRLDVETDGPVVVCKTWRNQRFLRAQMDEHVFSKAYICLVHGRVENRIQYIKAKFAELGHDQQSCIMLKHDGENDPFYNLSMEGKVKRKSRMAETFFKPLAYYRKDDKSEFSLVYVNILSGITHQIRITMQSVGHPLVSDDRYLPRQQAMSDISWCPRNFLCEVRQDWFDMCGPHKDPSRKPFSRISIENPLPKLFQDILEKKLTLVEKLDPTADLLQGTQYWALGDEQLMAAYPKDDEYRKKVMRWGQRRGIHLDAMNRLLMLKQEVIDKFMNEYRPHEDPEEGTWVCPKCMQYNKPNGWNSGGDECTNFRPEPCQGRRLSDDSEEVVSGYRNFLAEPTIHALMLINPLWLQARRDILKNIRPTWEKPPKEEEGDFASKAQIQSLEAALVLDAKAGGYGIMEEDLKEVPGLQDAKQPLRLPPDCTVRRMRLPSFGISSQWTYALTGKERLKHTEDFSVRTKKLGKPPVVNTSTLPKKMLVSKEEKVKREREQERQAAEEKEREELEEREKKFKQQKEHQEWVRKTLADSDEPPAKRRKKQWKRLESSSNPGTFYYMDAESGDTQPNTPSDFEAPPPQWECIASKSVPGEYYYHNKETGESRAERPKGVPILNDRGAPASVVSRAPAPTPVVEERARVKDEGIPWKRMESKSKPGMFFYYNELNGANEIKPPQVKPPWQLLESKSKKGQYYYFNQVTGENSEHPPTCAVPYEEAKRQAAAAKSSSNSLTSGGTKADVLPKGWEKKMSSTHGKCYYQHIESGESRWVKPMWEKTMSSSVPGKYYYTHMLSGKTTWDKKETEE